jgi:hypothetical protein
MLLGIYSLFSCLDLNIPIITKIYNRLDITYNKEKFRRCTHDSIFTPSRMVYVNNIIYYCDFLVLPYENIAG